MAERKVTVIINANVRKFSKGMDFASKRLKKFGRTMERTGQSLTRSITAPALAAGAGAVKMASDFESSMTKIETLVGLSRDQVQGMRKDVLNLARGTGKAPQELSEALFTVTSAGLRGASAMQVLERASKASAIGLGNTRDIAQATTAIMQAYGEDVMSASLATDTLTAIVREGNLEASELAPTLGRVVGIASQLGISFQEVGASIATFTRLGVSSEEAVVGLRGVMNALLKPTNEGRKALNGIGLSFDELRKKVQQEGLMKTLRMLVERFGGNDEALSALIPNVRALSAVLGTAGAQGEAYEEILGNIQRATGIVNEGFEKVSETTEFKFNKALASLKASTIELGTILLPVANKIIERVQDMAEWFGKLSTEAQTFGLKIATVAIAIGPTLLVLGKLAKLIAFMVSPTFLATAAITALFAGVVTTGQWFVDNWAKISQKLSNVTQSVVIAFQEMGKGIMIALREVLSFILTKIPPVAVAEFFGVDVTGFAADITGIQGAIDSLDNTIREGKKKLTKGIQRDNSIMWGSFTDSAKNAFELTKNSIIKGLEGILESSQIQSLIEKMNSMFSVSPTQDQSLSPESGVQVAKTPNVPTFGGAVKSLDLMKVKIKENFDPMEGFKNRMQAISNAEMIAMDIGRQFTSSFGEGMANVIVQGEKLIDVLKNVGKLLLSSAIQKGLLILLMGGLGGTGFGSRGIFGSIFKGVGKVFGMANGGIVPGGFPNDSYPAMLSSGETVIPSPKPLPSFGMSGKIEVPVYLNDREIARAMGDYMKDLGR